MKVVLFLSREQLAAARSQHCLVYYFQMVLNYKVLFIIHSIN